MDQLTENPPVGGTDTSQQTPWCLGCGNQTVRTSTGTLWCVEPLCAEFRRPITGEYGYFVPVDPASLTGCEACE